jgi:putative endonuclease
MRTYWVYILASKPYGSLYIGVTTALRDRVAAHRNGSGSKFTSRYGVTMLVHYEPFENIENAIQREKSSKRYLRDWKINLIERDNPRWVDLYPALLALPGNAPGRLSGEMGPRDKPEDHSDGAGIPGAQAPSSPSRRCRYGDVHLKRRVA